jgi:hypothetical protein
MSAFETTKQSIGPYFIVITSWYDDRREYWRACAPLYTYLELFTCYPCVICSSRQEAVEHVSDLLAIHLERLDRSDSVEKGSSHANPGDGVEEEVG